MLRVAAAVLPSFCSGIHCSPWGRKQRDGRVAELHLGSYVLGTTWHTSRCTTHHPGLSRLLCVRRLGQGQHEATWLFVRPTHLPHPPFCTCVAELGSVAAAMPVHRASRWHTHTRTHLLALCRIGVFCGSAALRALTFWQSVRGCCLTFGDSSAAVLSCHYGNCQLVTLLWY